MISYFTPVLLSVNIYAYVKLFGDFTYTLHMCSCALVYV